MKNKIETCTDCHGNCSRCGECCTIAIPITKKEEKIIKNYIKKNDVKPENLFENNNFYAMCCFYDRKNHKCKIYDVRPRICRSFKCNKSIDLLEKEKKQNHKKAFWNHLDNKGNYKNVTTFDLLFYNDPRPILTLLFRTFTNNKKEITNEKFERIILQMKKWGLGELADSLVPEFYD